MLVATVRALRNDNYDFQSIVLYVGGAVLAVLLVSMVADVFRDRGRKKTEAPAGSGDGEYFDPMAGGYPLPPMPGQTLPPVPRRRPRGERQLVGTAESSSESTSGEEAGDA